MISLIAAIKILVVISVALVVYWGLLPYCWRKHFLLALNLCFLFMTGLAPAGYILVILLTGYFFIKKTNKNNLFFIFSIMFMVGQLLFFKLAQKTSAFHQVVLPLGLSYITFRLIHYLVDFKIGKIKKINWLDLATYVLFFPTLIAGPVERFENFDKDNRALAKNKRLSTRVINQSLSRISWGLIKLFFLANILGEAIFPIFNSINKQPYFYVVLALYGLLIQIYWSFSGYTDLAVGIAALFGYKIMENFNRPLFQPNIALFWRNWHISVYAWIRDYFFLPLFSLRASYFKLLIGLFATMIVFHLWHVVSWSFFALGVYHGAGLILWQIFQEVKKRHPLIKKMFAGRFYYCLSVFLTFNYVSLGLIFFYFEDPATLLSVF